MNEQLLKQLLESPLGKEILLAKTLPTEAMVRIDPLLSNIASQWIIDDSQYVCQRIFPLVQTSEITGLIAQYTRHDFFRVHDVRPRDPGVESQGGGFRIAHNLRYICKEWAFHMDVADELRAQAQAPISLDRDAANFVTQLLKLKRDYQFAQAAWAAGIWGTDVTGIAGATNYLINRVRQWDDYVTPSAPQADIDYYRRRMMLSTGGFKPNRMACTRDVWDALKNHPAIVARYVQTAGGGVPQLTTMQVANYLELDDIVVCDTVGNFGIEGGQWIGRWMFGQGSALLYYVPSSPSVTQPAAGYTMGWTGANHLGSTVAIERYRLANDAKADRIVGNFHFDVRTVETVLGVFFTGLCNPANAPVEVVI